MKKMKKVFLSLIAFYLGFFTILSFTSINKASALKIKGSQSDIGSQLGEIHTIQGGHLLSYYTKAEKDKFLEKSKKRKMFGARIKYLNDSVRVTFTREVIQRFTNTGYQPIEFNKEYKEKRYSKFIASFGSGHDKEFKGSLSGFSGKINKKLSFNVSAQVEIEKDTKTSLKTQIEPGTQLSYTIEAIGVVRNGALTDYIFWVESQSGLFEYCEVVSSFESIKKEKVVIEK